MSCEPESDCHQGPMTPSEWALWAVFGTDRMRYPPPGFPLNVLLGRIEQAICSALKAAEPPQERDR